MTDRDEIDFEDDESIEARLQAVQFVAGQDGLDVSELTLQGGDDDYVGAIIDTAVSEMNKRNAEITRLNERVRALEGLLSRWFIFSSVDREKLLMVETASLLPTEVVDKARAALNTKDG